MIQVQFHINFDFGLKHQGHILLSIVDFRDYVDVYAN